MQLHALLPSEKSTRTRNGELLSTCGEALSGTVIYSRVVNLPNKPKQVIHKPVGLTTRLLGEQERPGTLRVALL